MTPRSARQCAGIVLAVLARAVLVHADADQGAERCIRGSEDALTQRKAGKLLEARTSLSTCAASQCPAVVRASCTQRLTDIQRSIPSIAFLTKDGAGHDLTAVQVTVDGGAYTGDPGGGALSLDPGPHTFRFEAAGRPPLSTHYVLLEGDQNRRETVVLSPAPDDGSKQRAIGLTVGAIGIAGLAAGGVLGLLSIGAHHGYEQNCGSNIGAPAGECNPAGLSGEQDAATKGTLSTIAFVVGGAALATGAILYVYAPSAPHSASGVGGVQIGFSAAGVTLRGSF